MDVCPALVADGQAAVLGQPCQRALHDPAPRDVIPLVSMQFLRPFPPSAPWGANQRNRRQQWLKEHGVMAVGTAQEGGEGDALSVDHNMALRARFAFIRRIRSGFTAPFFAGTLAESSEARDQSIWSASPFHTSVLASSRPKDCFRYEERRRKRLRSERRGTHRNEAGGSQCA